MVPCGGTDTSETGVGGWWRDSQGALHSFYAPWPTGTKAAVGTPYMETMGAAAWVHLFGDRVAGRVVVLLTDSAVTAADWTAGRSRRSAPVADALLVLDQHCIIHDVRVVLRLVPRAENGLADAASRDELTAWLSGVSGAQAVQEHLPPGWLEGHLRGAISSR